MHNYTHTHIYIRLYISHEDFDGLISSLALCLTYVHAHTHIYIYYYWFLDPGTICRFPGTICRVPGTT